MGDTMQKAIRRAAVGGMLILCAAGHFMQAQQQQSITSYSSDGKTRVVLDTKTGWTSIVDGQTSNMSAEQVTNYCNLMGKDPFLPDNDFGNFTRELCEEWGELQPKTKIERLPFSDLIVRLLLFTPPSTDFARYRGLQIGSDSTGVEYDSTIVPDDIGADVTCGILAGELSYKGKFIFKCTIKMHSYQEAITTKGRLVSLLANLKLTEDEVEEHGIAVRSRANGRCAGWGDGGECEGQQTYVTATKAGKRLQIAADPDFTFDPYLTLQTGHQVISGLMPDSATVTIEVYSIL